MSLFGSLMQDMESDPIFGAHHRAMNRMMNSFFGAPAAGAGGFGGFSLMGPPPMQPQQRHPQHHQQQHPHREESDDLMPFGGGHALSPFGMFGGFPDLSGMMAMNPAGNPGQHAFTSSSFMSFSSGMDGRPPQVYQATSETRHGPNGVKETRKTMTDSRSGTKKMAVGRHLGEQSHVVEREQNLRTGQMLENHEFFNLGEEEAPQFDREWKTRAHHGGSRGRYAHSSSMPAIAAAPSAAAPGPSASTSSRTRSYVEQAPEVVELDDDHDQPPYAAGYHPHRSQSAVTIEELPASDDEAEQLQQQTRSSRRTHASSASASSYRRPPHGASKEKRQKRTKLGKKY